MKNGTILFVAPSRQSFIENDISILQKRYKVKVNQYNWAEKKFALIYFLRQFFYLVFNIRKFDFIIVSFGGYWAFWPIVFGRVYSKSTYIILHGTDCASIPEINYGSLRLPLLKKFCLFSYSRASMLLPVSHTLVKSELKFDAKIKSTLQGIKNHFPNLRTKYKVIHNGVDPSKWEYVPIGQKKPKTFLAVFSQDQFILKGGDLITKIAENIPQGTFYVAGMNALANTVSPKNLIYLGELNQVELRKWYGKCTFYFQLSIFEGFGIALAEAMLSGCIPIVSNIDHFHQLIGDSGYMLKNKDIDAFLSLWEIIKRDNKLNKKSILAHQLIVENFCLDKREEELLTILKGA